MIRFAGMMMAAMLALGQPAIARSSVAPYVAPAKTARAVAVPRDTHGRIARSATAKRSFRKAHPCPAPGHERITGACPGYVIDHVKPLACGGADDPSNMQWQTLADGKAKDKWERKTCGGQ